jgi:hypothetical protein
VTRRALASTPEASPQLPGFRPPRHTEGLPVVHVWYDCSVRPPLSLPCAGSAGRGATTRQESRGDQDDADDTKAGAVLPVANTTASMPKATVSRTGLDDL